MYCIACGESLREDALEHARTKKEKKSGRQMRIPLRRAFLSRRSQLKTSFAWFMLTLIISEIPHGGNV